MKHKAYTLDIITPCFCGGAKPAKQAETRAPSIRGQLRWWFRVLGGFKVPVPDTSSLRDQEDYIFGSAAGDTGSASRLIVRVLPRKGALPKDVVQRDAAGMQADVTTPRGYLLFPLRSNLAKGDDKRRALFDVETTPASFDLIIQWRGHSDMWESIEALIAVFGHLGSLGFRSRRAMGALAFSKDAPDLAKALRSFAQPDGIDVRQLPALNAKDAIVKLADWLRSWRCHGRTGNNVKEQAMPGYPYAKQDHDSGLGINKGPVFRAALGLPIIQFYSGGRRPADWAYAGPTGTRRGGGRFASPVILRPCRSTLGEWKGLVIFVETRKWPSRQPVFVDGRPRAVSLDLYEQMKTGLATLF